MGVSPTCTQPIRVRRGDLPVVARADVYFELFSSAFVGPLPPFKALISQSDYRHPGYDHCPCLS